MKKKLSYFGMASLFLTALASCESGMNEFSDFDYQTVYFANQYAERTLELGEDEFVDNSIDNEHKVSIKAAWGGGYTNRENVIIDFIVDESLCDNLYFSGTDTPVTPMPSNYYELASNQINIPSGQISGGVEVQLTDAFFADEKTVGNYYVIPLRMTDVQGADSILLGNPVVDNPTWTNSNDWSVQPQNFVLYAVKYVNVWHGEYLRRGVDKTVINGVSGEAVRGEVYIEDDEVVYMTTNSLSDSNLSLTAKNAEGKNLNYSVNLHFADDGSCTMSSPSDTISVSGGGNFVKDGEKNSLGGKDRDVLYLDYTVDFKTQNIQYETKDTLVLRTRGVQGGKTFTVERR